MLVVDGLNIPYFPTAVNGSGRVFFGARSGRVGSGRVNKKRPWRVNARALVGGSLTRLEVQRPTRESSDDTAAALPRQSLYFIVIF